MLNILLNIKFCYFFGIKPSESRGTNRGEGRHIDWYVTVSLELSAAIML